MTVETKVDPSAKIGELLLKGYTMLADVCGECGVVPLMRDRQGQDICVICNAALGKPSSMSPERLAVDAVPKGNEMSKDSEMAKDSEIEEDLYDDDVSVIDLEGFHASIRHIDSFIAEHDNERIMRTITQLKSLLDSYRDPTNHVTSPAGRLRTILQICRRLLLHLKDRQRFVSLLKAHHFDSPLAKIQSSLIEFAFSPLTCVLYYSFQRHSNDYNDNKITILRHQILKVLGKIYLQIGM